VVRSNSANSTTVDRSLHKIYPLGIDGNLHHHDRGFTSCPDFENPCGCRAGAAVSRGCRPGRSRGGKNHVPGFQPGPCGNLAGRQAMRRTFAPLDRTGPQVNSIASRLYRRRSRCADREKCSAGQRKGQWRSFPSDATPLCTAMLLPRHPRGGIRSGALTAISLV